MALSSYKPGTLDLNPGPKTSSLHPGAEVERLSTELRSMQHTPEALGVRVGLWGFRGLGFRPYGPLVAVRRMACTVSQTWCWHFLSCNEDGFSCKHVDGVHVLSSVRRKLTPNAAHNFDHDSCTSILHLKYTSLLVERECRPEFCCQGFEGKV